MDYLSETQIVFINREIVSIFDEPFTIRDSAALYWINESVKKRFNLENKIDSIIHKAAFLMWEITDRHAFAEGNKRTALVAAVSFLKINGHSINPHRLNQDRLSALEWAVARKQISFKKLVKTIKESLS